MKVKTAELSRDIESQYLSESIHASVSKHLLDEHFTLVAANDQYYEMFGYKKEEYEILFHNRPDLFYKTDPEAWQQLSQKVIKTIQNGENRYEHIGRMNHKDGRKLWVKLVGTFTDDYMDGYRISFSVMMDITDLMQTKIEHDATQSNFPGFISKYRVTEQGFTYLEGNHNFRSFFQGKRSFQLDEMDEKSGLLEIAKKWKQIRNGENVTLIISPTNALGSKRYLNVNAQCIDWMEHDPIYLLLYTDITNLNQQKEKLEEYNKTLHKLVYSDLLTGGFNRRKFDYTAGQTIPLYAAKTYSMIWLNMQKFKIINEKSGVEAGDKTLRYIHQKILDNLKKDEFVARLFSDNFVILMKNKDQSIAERLKQLAQDINAYNHQSEFKYYLTFTAGIYLIDDPNLSLTYMEDRAHAARKSNGQKGSGLCICNDYTEAIGQQMLNEKDMENRMRDALKDGQFEVYLQPKFSIKQDKIAGAEALVRWNDPKHGLISPSDFIPLFEANGFIIDLDIYVFEQVCKLLHSWQLEHIPLLPISINMSRLHFASTDFINAYVTIADKYQIPHQYLEIELTETMVFEHPEEFKNIIQIIHHHGFPCAMDDFGSGYSSLNALKDLDVDVIKLDKAFFSSASMQKQKENIIVSSMTDMIKSLHMVSIAEGIETKAQLDFLKQTPCDMIQGYYLSRPLPIDKFNLLMKQK